MTDLSRQAGAGFGRGHPAWESKDSPPVIEGFRFHRPGGWLRFESGWLSGEQCLRNLETVVSLLQKAMEGLSGIDRLITDAVAAVKEISRRGDPGGKPPGDIAGYVNLRLDQIDEIVRQSRFHGRGLLDGQSGVTGIGVGIDFIRGGGKTRSSPPEGYEVTVDVLPSRATMKGGVAVDEAWVRAEEEIFLAEGEQFFRYRLEPEETVSTLLKALREESQVAGLDVEIGISAQGHLAVRHNQYGSQYKFKGCSFKTPLLSHRPGKVERSWKGRDIQGRLGGEPTFGIGRMLIGYLDNENTSELTVMWRNGGGGRCHVVQNALRFQEGIGAAGDLESLALPSFESRQLGRWMDTVSGFRSLANISFDTWQQVRDALYQMMAVSFEVEEWLERGEAWIKRYQNRALACLREGGDFRAVPPHDDEVTVEQAEQMARELREMIQGSLKTPEHSAR